VAVVGASGCGKSTLLRIVAGLEDASRGAVAVAGRPVAGRPSRAVGVVFQEPRLMPWLSARDNVAFGLHRLPRAERDALANAALARVHLDGFADALPKQLSAAWRSARRWPGASSAARLSCCSTSRSAPSTR
jgi:sulfonate transport system ATP-binding protein